MVSVGDRAGWVGPRLAHGAARPARALLRIPRGSPASLMSARTALWSLLAGVLACVLVAVHVSWAADGPSAAAGATEPGTVGATGTGADWASYGGDAGASHYSPLTSIAPSNVSKLKLAWSYQVAWPRGKPTTFEVTPLKVGDLVYVCLPLNDVVALDADTGAVRWKYAAHVRDWAGSTICRGLSYFEAPAGTADCPQRLLMASGDATLRAIDAHTGAPCKSFGNRGLVDLLEGLGPMKKGVYTPTSPPAIIHGLAVVGSGVPDNGEVENPSGVVRAYDATTGKLVWAWDLDHPDWHGEPPVGEHYSRNTPNAWSLMSADENLGLVYVPTGNSNPDYYGAHRSAQSEKYSSSVVALDAATGAVRWSFQTVHHDLWDYDVGAQPVLADIPGANGTVPALIQATKTGQVFVLDRRDGHPVSKVE